MPTPVPPSFELFFDVLQTLEDIGAPYMVIGAFAAMLYGTTRVTYEPDVRCLRMVLHQLTRRRQAARHPGAGPGERPGAALGAGGVATMTTPCAQIQLAPSSRPLTLILIPGRMCTSVAGRPLSW